MKFTECNKIVKKQAFERAIRVDQPEKTLAEAYQALDSICKDLEFQSRFVYLTDLNFSNRRRLP